MSGRKGDILGRLYQQFRLAKSDIDAINPIASREDAQEGAKNHNLNELEEILT